LKPKATLRQFCKEKAAAVVKATVDELVSRLFGGSTMPLMRHLIEERSVSADELSELRQLIERLEKERNSE
jgi:predicted transcriptional regulator